MQKIVEQTCKEYGIRYFAFDDFWGAIKSNIMLLKELGKQPKAYGGHYEYKSYIDR